MLTDAESGLLNKGLSFGLQTKTKKLDNTIEKESLFMQLVDKNNGKTVQIYNAEDLKTKLKSFGKKHFPDTSKNPLTRDEHKPTKL